MKIFKKYIKNITLSSVHSFYINSIFGPVIWYSYKLAYNTHLDGQLGPPPKWPSYCMPGVKACALRLLRIKACLLDSALRAAAKC